MSAGFVIPILNFLNLCNLSCKLCLSGVKVLECGHMPGQKAGSESRLWSYYILNSEPVGVYP